jgi:pyrroline-5-carboxylate reductase
MADGYEIGFIGAGNMAEAIARGALEGGVLAAGEMIASDPSAPRKQVFEKMGIKVVDSNAEVIASSKQVLLAIKPQVLGALAGDLAEHGCDGLVLISIMAGIGTGKLAQVIADGGLRMGDGKGVETQGLSFKPRIVRVMPNTPMMVGLGMSGLAVGEHAQAGDEKLAMKLFGAAGEVVRVEERLMDAVTAVSGSGPAYVYYLAEAMEKAAGELGLGEHARVFVSQTILGAAKMLVDSPDEAGELRRKVTSPGGTTAAAIEHMETEKVGDAIVEAVKAAEARGRALGG